jgi:fructose-1,6-bisphosphatase/inositol monophosphatase family enzyme
MSDINPDQIANILVECADKYILPRYKKLENHEVLTKTSPTDLVTQADIDVEAHLERVLPDLLPGSIVVGEEGVSRGDAFIDVLGDDTQKIWVVDPVDGTSNFVHHKREFGVMLALVVGGQTVASWIYDVLGEKCAISQRGAGAYFGGEKMQVAANIRAPADMIGYLNARFFPKEHKPHIKEVVSQFKSCKSLYCAAHQYLNIGQGKAHFSVSNHIKSWDHLAGALLIEEAGGYLAKWDGAPYMPRDHHCGLLVSTSKENWAMLHDEFLKEILES